MYAFSPEHLERLRSQLAFKNAVVVLIKSKVQSSTTEIDGFDSKYIAQLAHAPLLEKLALDILELEVSIEMLEAFLD